MPAPTKPSPASKLLRLLNWWLNGVCWSACSAVLFICLESNNAFDVLKAQINPIHAIYA
ncbi:hypothetical protein RSal33209_0208 [Renibacterium salmoninarum ATCC 33209]|uniref:Uncharacterized protein n=1 Tax=Renibacterium salmoninarum (strain ATCC 33209 / DSM 20767 / JCM 11484 / NBRC 15589 / NCIMB 2235) TaxID=288705 RepID=A9WLK4_RENSM|nr:hypothetical protein RSal33209_0208 [Renibacterium salmoninarum ATCC 33209]